MCVCTCVWLQSSKTASWLPRAAPRSHRALGFMRGPTVTCQTLGFTGAPGGGGTAGGCWVLVTFLGGPPVCWEAPRAGSGAEGGGRDGSGRWEIARRWDWGARPLRRGSGRCDPDSAQTAQGWPTGAAGRSPSGSCPTPCCGCLVPGLGHPPCGLRSTVFPACSHEALLDLAQEREAELTDPDLRVAAPQDCSPNVALPVLRGDSLGPSVALALPPRRASVSSSVQWTRCQLPPRF